MLIQCNHMPQTCLGTLIDDFIENHIGITRVLLAQVTTWKTLLCKINVARWKPLTAA